MSDDCIRVLSLNCWGLKYVSKNRAQRIQAIAHSLSTSSYDIVCLQEVWVRDDFEHIRVAVSSRLLYDKIFHRRVFPDGVTGAGLAIFSRYPIIAASLLPYSLNGHPLDFKGADWFAGKAAASVLVTHPILGEVQVFNTHFFSEGGDDGPEHNRAHRLVNAWEFAKLVRQVAEVGRHVIAAGDFNSAPSTLPMIVIREHAGLEDAWGTLHPPAQPAYSNDNSPNPVEALSLHGFTYDSPLNSYSAHVQAPASAPLAKRLDYIFIRNPRPSALSLPRLTPTDARVVFTEPIPGREFSYSDHFGVEATFAINRADIKDDMLFPALDPDRTHVTTIPASTMPTSASTPCLSHEHTMTVIHALETHLTHSKARARREMCVVAMCSFLLVAVLVGTGWSPRGFLTPVFVFLGIGATYIGTTLFHVGFLYHRWEANALRNAIDEMMLYAQGLGSRQV
ncbi:inositol phosphophingolipids phospholipase C [Vararia minispora EC-137]|uniref:Inositol phosphophingolipids phospholipase C n=1 Tax=Vararia minispora EC-137 TaxID=1314806 RepID=A0ACB8QER0_9AGAM|nr:inositol phosphophingolipids phospholipase C [Vararia minispora EC-137]